jgi:predicted protein tyrosine phosphatase
MSGLAARIRVSALFNGRLQKDLQDFRPTHVISLLDPTLAAHALPTFASDTVFIQRAFFDGDAPPSDAPNEVVVRELIAFIGDWIARERNGHEARLLVHCHAGAGRSTGVAFVALAMQRAHGQELEAFADLLRITNKPWPNINVVKLADGLLARDGRLLAPLQAYRTSFPRRIDAYRRLNRKRGIV